MTEAKMVVNDRAVHFLDDEDHRAGIDRADQIPVFPDEAAERAWWGERTLSEEFWRNAERPPDDELPPTRAPQVAAPTAPATQGGLSAGQAFFFGLTAGAGIVVGAWLLYRLFLRGKAAVGAGGVSSTPANLSVFPLRPAVDMLSRMAR
jgi:hypothetical protein